MSLPACAAVTSHEPAPVMWTVLPETVHLPVAAKVTGLPDPPPVALTVKSGLPKVLSANALNVMVWLALAILKLRFLSVAAL